MAVKQHGVYVTETPTSLVTPVEGTAGLQVVFGTAPVNQLADPASAVNKPIVAYSFVEAQEQLGYSSDYDNFTICQSMDASFRLFNVAPIIFINVLDPAKHTSTVAAKTYEVNGKFLEIAESGMMLDTLEVTATEGSTALIKDEDYVAVFNASGNVEITFKATRTTVSIKYSKLDGSKVTENDIIGGYDSSTGKVTGLELLGQVYPRFGMTPGLMIAPGFSHKTAVAAVMQAKCEEINGVYRCECILDLDTTKAKKYGDCADEKEKSGFTSKHAAVMWPMVMAAGKKYYYSAVFAALTAYTDAANDDIPYMSPSNKLANITATVLADGTEVILDQTQANVLNGAGIITALNLNGWRSWGNNTAIYPMSKDPKDCWFCVRRFFSWYANSFILTYLSKVDDPANYRLIESIVDTENIRANTFVPDKCAGLSIEYRQEDNPVTSVLDGKMKFKIHLAPYTPAETIIADLEYSPDMLEAALSA